MATILLSHPTNVINNYYTDEAIERLSKFATVRFNKSDRAYSTEGLIEAARGCQILITNPQLPLEAPLFEQSPDLVALVRCANDLGNVAIETASANGILITHVRPAFVPSVTELIIGFMIDLGRTITKSASIYRSEERQPPVTIGRQLYGSTLGVVGYGPIGRYLCDMGLALGMRVLVCDPYVDFTRPGIEQVDFGTLLSRADFLVCLAKATPETQNLMNAEAFARMQPTAFFINASRGVLVDEEALERALDTGQIAGAALDVGRQPGNMPTVRLAARHDVVATPHLGGRTPSSIIDPAAETVDQVTAILRGEAPLGSVNAAHATRLARFKA